MRTAAEAFCADPGAAQDLTASRRDLVQGFCRNIGDSRAAAEDATSHLGELIRDCDAERAGACLLGGAALALGVGAPPDMSRGTALLTRACQLGCSVDCEGASRDGTHTSPVLRLAQLAQRGRIALGPGP